MKKSETNQAERRRKRGVVIVNLWSCSDGLIVKEYIKTDDRSSTPRDTQATSGQNREERSSHTKTSAWGCQKLCYCKGARRGPTT